MAETDWVMCPNCKGTGSDLMSYSFAGICGTCIGTGKVRAAPTTGTSVPNEGTDA